MRTLPFMAVILLVVSSGFAQVSPTSKIPKPTRARAVKPDTSHLDFVKEFIRQLSALEDIRAKGEQENTEDNTNGKAPFASAIHTGTLFKLELGADVAELKESHFNDPFDTLVPTLTQLYLRKSDLWQKMIDISTEFMSGPKPGMDYGKVAAQVPQIRGQMDYLDDTIFQVTPIVFELLIDDRADSQGHASHLIITKAERADLVDTLDTDFGDKLNQPNPKYLVGAASVLKAYLQKDFKASDDPWE